MADERHFLAPTAAYEDRHCPGYRLTWKHAGSLWEATQDYSPYDVVGWHGNHVPYKYDLRSFNAYGSVSWDHADPSILTVLTCPHDDHGRNAVDFAVFPPRWDVTEGTYRPPYYHRNAATEFNAVVSRTGNHNGYEKGVYFLTPLLSPHGIGQPSNDHVVGMSDEEADKPSKGRADELWIQFESTFPMCVTPWALEAGNVDIEYNRRDMWQNMTTHFTPDDPAGGYES